MHLRTILALAVLAGCSDSATIEGTLLDESAANEVLYLGAHPAEVIEGGFRVEDVREGTVRLRFVGEDGEASMVLTGVPGSGRIVLHDVFIADDLAFPTRVEMPGDELLSVNGLRMGRPDRIGGERELRGTVLAISPEDGTLLLRPDDAELPDVGVFIGTGTVLRTAGGAPVDLGRVRFGDTLVVQGSGASGYFISSAILTGGDDEAGPNAPDPGTIEPVSPIDIEEEERERADSDDDDRDSPGQGRGRGRPNFTPGRRN